MLTTSSGVAPMVEASAQVEFYHKAHLLTPIGTSWRAFVVPVNVLVMWWA